jgi:hypothetical protein
MSEEPDRLVLRYMRRIEERRDRLAAAVVDVEGGMHPVEQQSAGVAGQCAGLSARIEHIERRLGEWHRLDAAGVAGTAR